MNQLDIGEGNGDPIDATMMVQWKFSLQPILPVTNSGRIMNQLDIGEETGDPIDAT